MVKPINVGLGVKEAENAVEGGPEWLSQSALFGGLKWPHFDRLSVLARAILKRLSRRIFGADFSARLLS